jgi:hypothetical protein
MLYILIVWAIQLALYARFVSRFGYHPAWALATLFPLLGLVGLWFIAFAPWPIPDKDQLGSQSQDELAETFD